MKKVLEHRFTYVILTALLILVAAEVAVRQFSVWSLDVESQTGKLNAELNAALDRAPEPVIVFIGSSRFQYGISPSVVAQTVGLQEEEVANLFIEAGSPIDYLSVYKENRQILGNASILVINVGARDFNWNRPSMLSLQFRKTANYLQRAEVPGLKDKLDLMVGWYWKTWDVRPQLRSFATRLIMGDLSLDKMRNPEIQIDELERINALAKWRSVPIEMQPQQHPHKIEFYNFELAEAQVKALGELVQLAQEDGLEVMLVETPMNPLTVDEVEKSFSQEDDLWRQRVLEETNLPIKLIPFLHTTCDEQKDCFLDYGHMTPAGSASFSDAIGHWLLGDVPGAIDNLPM